MLKLTEGWYLCKNLHKAHIFYERGYIDKLLAIMFDRYRGTIYNPVNQPTLVQWMWKGNGENCFLSLTDDDFNIIGKIKGDPMAKWNSVSIIPPENTMLEIATNKGIVEGIYNEDNDVCSPFINRVSGEPIIDTIYGWKVKDGF